MRDMSDRKREREREREEREKRERERERERERKRERARESEREGMERERRGLGDGMLHNKLYAHLEMLKQSFSEIMPLLLPFTMNKGQIDCEKGDARRRVLGIELAV